MASRPGFPRSISSFARLVEDSAVSVSRRDLMRASAVVAAATATDGGAIKASPRQDSNASTFAQDVTTGVELHLPLNPFGETVTSDPHLAANWGPFWVFMPYAWSGLLRFDENGAVEPDLAESVEPNEDGTIWTSVLKDGVAYGDGTPVLAEHFVQSWRRALDPTRISPMSRFMLPVQGFDDYITGTNQELGFRAVDERTLEITLSEPISHFPSYLATFVWAVINPAWLEQAGEEPTPLDAAGAGPWRIMEFDEASRVVMVPNEHYWSAPSPSISTLVWDIAPGGGTDQLILDQYVADQIAIADVPASLFEAVNADAALAEELVTIEDHASTLAISLDFHQQPFNDVRVRRAVAHAIDRETWASDIQGGEFVPASSFTPPVLATIAGYEAPDGPNFDPEMATSLLEEAGIDLENQEQEIIYFQSATNSTDDIEQHAALLQMIADNTGLTIDHDANLTSEQITALRQDNGGLQFDIVQWWIDSNTPSILAIASQASEYNAGWINWEPGLQATGEATPGDDAAQYDELVTDAIATLDEAARNDAFAEAETLLLDNAVYIPLGYWVQRFLQKPWLQGTRQGPWSGSTPVRIDEEVVVIGDPGGTPAGG